MHDNPLRLDNSASDQGVRPRQSLSSKYELLGRLGAGGMAEVFLARAIGIDDFEKIVVLKRILGNKRSDPYFAGMLRDEARIAAFLSHPNIVQTHDIAIDGDDYFFTMEYLHGETVKKLLSSSRTAEEPVPLELILQIAVGCAAGLHHAHEQTDYEGRPLGIVHRDVSPSNVIVTRQSGVKLIDFGIAKAASGKEVTAVGTVKGKAAYMSPEQARGQGIDRRSDVFALGLMLYELVTQKRPFDADNELATLHKMLSEEPPPPTQVRPDCPVELERVIARAMRKNADERYPTAFEMQEELELVTRDCQLHALPGALGRYLEHLLGPKPHPWTQRAKAPPPVPRWAWADLDYTITARRNAEAAAAMTPASRTAPGTLQQPAAMSGTPSSVMPVTHTGAVAPAPPSPRYPTTDAQNWTSGHAPVPVRNRSNMLIVAALILMTVVSIVAISWPSSETDDPPEVALQNSAPLATPPNNPTPDPVPPPAVVPPQGEPELPTPEAAAPLAEPIPDEPVIEPDARPVAVAKSEPAKTRPARSATNRKAEAQSLAREARHLYFREPAKALELARRSVSLRRVTKTLSLYGALACRMKSMKDIKKAHRGLRGDRRAEMERTCAHHGVTL